MGSLKGSNKANDPHGSSAMKLSSQIVRAWWALMNLHFDYVQTEHLYFFPEAQRGRVLYSWVLELIAFLSATVLDDGGGGKEINLELSGII